MLKKTIPNYETYYVTSIGDVFNTNYHSTKQTQQLKFDYSGKSKCYKRVTFCKDGKTKRFLIHRLVALAFIDNPLNKPQVNHIDGNPSNNDMDNLEWCTQSENMKHAFRTGLQTPNITNAKLTKKNIFEIFEMRKLGLTHKEISLNFDVNRKCIGDVLNKKTWTNTTKEVTTANV